MQAHQRALWVRRVCQRRHAVREALSTIDDRVHSTKLGHELGEPKTASASSLP